MTNVPKMPDLNRFVQRSIFPPMPTDRCVLNRLRNSTNNVINRGILESSRIEPSMVHSSRKRISFGDDEPSSSQQSVDMTYMGGNSSSSFQSLLFDSNNNSNNATTGRDNGTCSSSFPKVEHDSPQNGVRKDVKLISDAAETEELFGKATNLHCICRYGGVSKRELRTVTALIK